VPAAWLSYWPEPVTEPGWLDPAQLVWLDSIRPKKSMGRV